MDKYEYKVRTDEMRQLLDEAKFAEAMEIADTIDWRRVKNTRMLCTVSDIYKINHKFEESKEILLLAYEKNPTSRMMVYSLCELCIKLDEVLEAYEYLKEFSRLAPKDNRRYILRYKLLEAQDVSLEERISVLEEYKNREPLNEKWAYELAYLYHRVGLVTRCIEECDQLFLWFREGKYVLKALELKQIHTPLTAEQQSVYDQQFYNTHRTHIPKTAYDGYEDEVKAEDNIEVPPMDVSEYNTINLQRELAESMREILPAEAFTEGTTVEEVLFSDTSAEEAPIFEDPLLFEEPFDLTKIPVTESFEAVNPEEAELVEETEENEVVTETDELPVIEEIEVEEEVSEEELVIEDITEESVEDIANQVTKVYKAITDEMLMQAAADEVLEQKEVKTVVPETEAAEEVKPKEIQLQENMTSKLPVEMARMLSQEYDGQIRLVVPETEQVEKQITGQLNIIDVMAEWEKIKKATEERRAEEVRQHVLEHTGNLFAEFEEASNKHDILAGVDLSDDEEVMDEDVIKEIAAEVTEELEEVAEVEAVSADSEEESEDVEVEVTEEIEETEEIIFEVSEEVSEEALEDMSEEVAEESLEVFEEDEEEDEDEETFEDEEEDNDSLFGETGELIIDDAKDLIINKSLAQIQQEKQDAKDDTPVRAFTSEEKMLFNSFIQTKRDKKKLVEALDEMSLAAYTGNVIITGEEAADTTTLAKAMIKSMQISDSNFSGKIAKITGAGLDNKDIKEVLEKLENGALIIETAHKMSKQSVNKLYKELEREDKGIIVFMEGPKGSMNKFMDKHDMLNKVFTARYDITGFSNKALVEYAKRYAREQEYSLDELAVLALHSRIDRMQTNDHKVTIDEVKDIVDEAIFKANKKNLKHFFDVLCSNRYDEEDMIILREKDFEE